MWKYCDSISLFFFFSPFFFSSTHVPLFFSFSHSFLLFPTTSSKLQNVLESSLSSSFFLFYFYFFFLSLFSLSTSSAGFFPSIPSKHTNLKVTHNHTIDSHQTKIEKGGNCQGRNGSDRRLISTFLPPVFRNTPLSSANLLCLHRYLSSSPPLLDLFSTANDMQ